MSPCHSRAPANRQASWLPAAWPPAQHALGGSWGRPLQQRPESPVVGADVPLVPKLLFQTPEQLKANSSGSEQAEPRPGPKASDQARASWGV